MTVLGRDSSLARQVGVSQNDKWLSVKRARLRMTFLNHTRTPPKKHPKILPDLRFGDNYCQTNTIKSEKKRTN